LLSRLLSPPDSAPLTTARVVVSGYNTNSNRIVTVSSDSSGFIVVVNTRRCARARVHAVAVTKVNIEYLQM
jgi:hypothetical protein